MMLEGRADESYSVRISDALFAELTHEARKRGLSISALARERLTASFAAAPALTRGPRPRLTSIHESKANSTPLNPTFRFPIRVTSPRTMTVARAIAGLLIFWTTGTASAAEIRVLSGSAIETAMRELIPAFERRTGHIVSHDFDAAIGQTTARVRDGEHADVVIVSRAQINELIQRGRLTPGSDANLAKVAIGIFVRSGAPKPDIGSVDAFKRTMLATRSIGWNDPAAGAPVSLYMLGLFQRLGIAAQMQAKTVAFKQRSERFAAVARGDVEIGFNQVSEIIAAPGVDLVGPLPDEIQNYTLFAAGVGAGARDLQASRAFVDFITSKDARAVWTAKGFVAP